MLATIFCMHLKAKQSRVKRDMFSELRDIRNKLDCLVIDLEIEEEHEEWQKRAPIIEAEIKMLESRDEEISKALGIPPYTATLNSNDIEHDTPDQHIK